MDTLSILRIMKKNFLKFIKMQSLFLSISNDTSECIKLKFPKLN